MFITTYNKIENKLFKLLKEIIFHDSDENINKIMLSGGGNFKFYIFKENLFLIIL
jgi:hypothetical protein